MSQGDDLSRALIGTGFAYEPETRARQARVLAELLSQVRDIRRGGSAAIDLAWVACGRLDGYYELGTRHWDRAAGMLLVAEAGGVATPLDDGGRGSEGALAAGGSLHPKLASWSRRRFAVSSHRPISYTEFAFRSRLAGARIEPGGHQL